jgi:hypothetical protein
VSGTASQIGIPFEQLQADLAAQIAQNQNIRRRLAEGGLGATVAARLRERLDAGRQAAAGLRTDIRTFDSSGGGAAVQNTYNVTVNGGLGVDAQDLGKTFVEEIIKFQRRSGEFLLEA